LNIFADLKLIDIPETLRRDGLFLSELKPELVTVMCVAGEAAMKALKETLPGTEVLGVTVLTHLSEEDAQVMFNCSVQQGVLRFANTAKRAGIDGLISSPKEATLLRGAVGDEMTLNTPAIRPAWSIVKNDDQNAKRVMTPADAIRAGADRIVVGRPIIQADNPYDAAMQTIEEIASATAG
jgi:orotidine-5'-phosphate decarboxylase